MNLLAKGILALTLTLSCSIGLLGQIVEAAKAPLAMTDIVNRLKSLKKSERSAVNILLIQEVSIKGVSFVPTEDDRRQLKKAGATGDLLVEVARAGALFRSKRDAEYAANAEREKKIFDEIERLSEVIRVNYSTNDPARIKVRVLAADELIGKYYGEGYGHGEFFQWVRIKLPEWRAMLKAAEEANLPNSAQTQNTDSGRQKSRCEILEGQQRAIDPERQSVTSFHIINKLAYTSRITKPNEELNKELIAEVKKKGVDFVLSEQITKSIKGNRGTDELLKAIENALPTETKGKLRDLDRLDVIIRENYARNTTLRRAIDAGKEMLKKYSDEPTYCEFIEWLKVQMPKWESRHRKSTETHFSLPSGLTPFL